MKEPRGIRNNNPLNIRHSADRWQGARGEQKDKSFVQFKSMAYGYRAAWKTLQSYYNRFCHPERSEGSRVHPRECLRDSSSLKLL